MDGISPILQVAATDDVALQQVRQEKAFEALEEMFISILLKEMRKSIPDSGLIEKSQATKMYEEMMDEAFAAQMAKSGQMGIAKGLAEQMRAQQVREVVAGQGVDATAEKGLEPLKL